MKTKEKHSKKKKILLKKTDLKSDLKSDFAD